MSVLGPLEGDARVLVRLPSWLGDFVAAEPLLRALEAHLARGRLGLLGLEPHLALLEGRFPAAARLPLAARGADTPAAYAGWDVALLCTGSFRSAWCAFRARVPRRVGLARDGRGWLLTDGLVPARERGRVPLGLGRAGGGRRSLPRPLERVLAELAGCLGVVTRDLTPRLAPSDASVRAARERRAALGLPPERPFVLVNAGARPGSSKAVPPALWAGAIRRVRAADAARAFVLAAGPGEESALDALERALDGEKVVVLRAPAAGLAELLAHTADCEEAWCGDTGPRHLARALGKPVRVVAGPTDPRHSGLREGERLLRHVVACGPCHRERCPLSGAEAHRCMTMLVPEELAALG